MFKLRLECENDKSTSLPWDSKEPVDVLLVVTHTGNAWFVENALKRAHTIVLPGTSIVLAMPERLTGLTRFQVPFGLEFKFADRTLQHLTSPSLAFYVFRKIVV